MPLFNPSLDVQLFRCDTPRKLNTYFIRYPISKLDTFLAMLKSFNESKARFLIDSDFQLWLAREGVPGGRIPPHSQLTGFNDAGVNCIAAGNIKFSHANNTIVSITNKSGDFMPDFDSVKWLFGILLSNCGDTIFAETLEIEEFQRASLRKEQSYEIRTIEVLNEIKDLFPEDRMNDLKNQPADISELSFGRAVSKRTRDRDSLPQRSVRLADFFSTLPDHSAASSSESFMLDDYFPDPDQAQDLDDDSGKSKPGSSKRLF